MSYRDRGRVVVSVLVGAAVLLGLGWAMSRLAADDVQGPVDAQGFTAWPTGSTCTPGVAIPTGDGEIVVWNDNCTQGFHVWSNATTSGIGVRRDGTAPDYFYISKLAGSGGLYVYDGATSGGKFSVELASPTGSFTAFSCGPTPNCGFMDITVGLFSAIDGLFSQQIEFQDGFLSDGHILPSTGNSWDVGSTAVPWRNAFLTDVYARGADFIGGDGTANDVRFVADIDTADESISWDDAGACSADGDAFAISDDLCVAGSVANLATTGSCTAWHSSSTGDGLLDPVADSYMPLMGMGVGPIGLGTAGFYAFEPEGVEIVIGRVTFFTGAPGSGNSWELLLQEGGPSTTSVCTVSDAEVSCSVDFDHALVSTGRWKVVAGGTPTATFGWVSWCHGSVVPSAL